MNDELTGIVATLEPETPLRVGAATVVRPPAMTVDTVAPPEVVRQEVGVDRVLNLLIEYRERLEKVMSEIEVQSIPTTGSVRVASPSIPRHLPAGKEFLRMKPALIRLAAYSSGLIESARIPQLDKIELSLRLSELDAALDIASAKIK